MTKHKIGGLPKGYAPSTSDAEAYFKVWNSLSNYTTHETALSQLFCDSKYNFTNNTDISKVIIKVSVLNDFYSTKIYRVYDVARKIVSISDFDLRLLSGDLSLVDSFKDLEYTNSNGIPTKRVNYSFATKYCSHHQPDKFPIYDSYVDKVLRALRKFNPNAIKFNNADLRDYRKYASIIDTIRDTYGLKLLTYKELDRYLWQLGKRYFSPYIDAVNGKIDYSKFEL